MKTRILLADDHDMMRQGLKTLLAREADFDIVGEASTGREAMRMAAELRPEVIVMDIGMPDLSGVEATKRIRNELPKIRVVALSTHSDRHFVTGMLSAGASGYVLKSEALEDLVGAIRSVRGGRVYTSPKITDVVMQDYVAKLNRPPGEETATLTDRERQVLGLLAQGRKTREIAEQLHLSVNTVDTHRRHIMQKLDLHSIAELTKYAIREGITSIDG